MPLTLQAANFDDAVETLTLTFGREVSIAGFDGTQITVNAGVDTGWFYDGTGGTSLLDPWTVVIVLQRVAPAEGGVTMTASGASGIVAVDDGGTWAGASDLPLPWAG